MLIVKRSVLKPMIELMTKSLYEEKYPHRALTTPEKHKKQDK